MNIVKTSEQEENKKLSVDEPKKAFAAAKTPKIVNIPIATEKGGVKILNSLQ